MNRGRRSGACASCRKRRLKCDASLPRCRRCVREGIECDYSDLQWVTYTSEDLSVRNASRTRPDPPKQGQWIAHSFNSSRSSSASNHKRLQRRLHLSDGVLQGLNNTTFICHLGHGLHNDSIATKAQNLRWTGLTTDHQRGTLSWKCLSAFAQSFYGETNNDVTVARLGRQQYVDCLQVVGKALAEKGTTSNDTLQAVMILGAYEVMCTTRQNGWLSHSLGMEAVLKMNGVKRCADPEFFELFRGCRFLILLSALMMQGPSLLSKREWKVTPWELQGLEKNYIDRLVDFMADLVSMRHRLFRLEEDRKQIASEAMLVVDGLHKWNAEWTTTPDAEITIVPSSIPDRFPGMWTTVYSFDNLYGSNIFTMYKALLKVALETLLLSVVSGQLRPGDASVLLYQAQEAGRDICRTVEYHLAFTSGNAIAQSIMLWPLREAWEILGKGDTEVGRWIERRLGNAMSRPTWAKVSRYVLYNEWAAIRYQEDAKEDGIHVSGRAPTNVKTM